MIGNFSIPTRLLSDLYDSSPEVLSLSAVTLLTHLIVDYVLDNEHLL